MRSLIALATFVFALPAAADESDRRPMLTPEEAVNVESCIGDKFDTDEDLNEVSGITDRAIQD
ncbi:MAG: hypothetical protein VW405_18340, partial [Rhodospirillaceae bacterium]